ESRAARPVGSVPMCAEYMLTAEASVRASACALAIRARAWMFAYSGIAMAARMPMIATTIISSMSVKPRWVPSIFRFRCQKANILFSPLYRFMGEGLSPLPRLVREWRYGRVAGGESPEGEVL